MDKQRFESEVQRHVPPLLAALADPSGKTFFYNGFIEGTEVIIIGVRTSEDDAEQLNSVPLAVLCTQELFDRIIVESGDGDAQEA